MEQQLNDVYNLVCRNVKYLNNGTSVMDWIAFYLPVLKFYEKIGEKRVLKILKWYEEENNRIFLNNVKEAYEKLYNSYTYAKKKRIVMHSGEKVLSWVHHNRLGLNELVNQENFMAVFLIDTYNDVTLYSKSIRALRWDNSLKVFFKRLKQFRIYMEENGKKPNDLLICFEGTDIPMESWYHYYQPLIKKYANLGNKDAIFVSNDHEILGIDVKLKELLDYLKNNVMIPDDTVLFSNGTNMKNWLYAHKRLIFNYYLKGDICAKAIVYLLLEIDPYVYDKVLSKSVTEQIETIKTNYQYVKRPMPKDNNN